MAVSIQIRNIEKRFDAQRVVQDVSLDIEAGELFFLLGPSGCGKTTLLRCIAGFYIPESGTIHMGGRDITRLPPEERDTGMVFQSYALWPHMTVRENVAFGLELRRVPRTEIRRRVDEALALVRMSDRADYKPNALSGGQQQRVALARALVIQPQCLLLDEPLSNLDAKLRLEMRMEIRRICKQAGLTAIYVTHDQKEALSIADRLAVLDRGRIQQLGTPQEVYNRPRSRFIAHFIGETNFVEGMLARRTAEGAVIRTAMGDITSTAGLPADLQEGAAVCVSIRPEALRVGAPPPGEPNAFEAEIHETVYLGEMAQHQARTRAGGVPLMVFDLNPKTVAHAGAPQPATLWVPPENAIVLAE